ncbi:MAG: cysteine desulfurase [Nanoarchaeota archaeon]|nr:cysteine desulfurase [Nanoarchaeota archaeon]
MKMEGCRKDFPILKDGKLIYFDNACMTLKPKQVIDAVTGYYTEYSACGDRAHHRLGKRVTEEVAKSRNTLRKFINARKDEDIIFTKNATEAINLVANGLGLNRSDKVLTTDREHNSNLLPWQRCKAKHEVFNVEDEIDLDSFEEQAQGTRLVSFPHICNMDGMVLPVKDMIKRAHKQGALVLVDAAQSVPHTEVDVRSLDADFIAFSGHKMCGPTGTGVLYGKKELLEGLSPLLLGGDTVLDSTYESYTLAGLPSRLEAGLQNYAGIIGFGQAAAYLKKIGLSKIEKHETALNQQLKRGIKSIKNVRLLGPENSSGITGFMAEGIDPHNIAMLLDQTANIMVRSGQHCVHSWFNSRGLPGSVRASLYLYNTAEEVETFINQLSKVLSKIS